MRHMKNNFKKLMEYFKLKYNPRWKGDHYRLVADELGITERHLRNILDGKTKPGASLELLAEKVVQGLAIKDLIK
jgi:energy-converting hydrogenase A subunit M